VPDVLTKNVAVWPTRMDSLIGCAVIVGVTVVPVPVIWIMKVELSCEPLKEAAPDALPAEVGAKLAVNVTLLPGFRFTGSATPPIANPAPEALAWEIVRALVPELVIVKLWLVVLPTETLPKVTAAGLALSTVEGTEFGVAELAEVELIAAVVEGPLALVTPAQPERIMVNAYRVEVRKRIRPRGLRRASGWMESNHPCKFFEVDTRRRV
jgi:hypothetical protein